MKKNLLYIAVTFASVVTYAQQGNVGVNTVSPKATLDVAQKTANNTSDVEGILIPRVSKNKAFLIGGNALIEESTLIYVTDLSDYTTTPVDATVLDITEKGYYSWNGTKWVQISSQNGQEWKDGTNTNGDNLIYANQAKVAGNDVVVTDEGRLGVGIGTPRSLLNVVADNVGDGINNVELEAYTQTNSIPSFVTSTYNGTKLAPSSVSGSQIIGNFATRGYDGSQLKYASSISTVAENDFSVSSKVSMFFSLNDGVNLSPQERMVIKSNGNVGIGITTPTAKLHINNQTSGGIGFRLVDGFQAKGRVLTSDANGNARWQNIGLRRPDPNNVTIWDATSTGSKVDPNGEHKKGPYTVSKSGWYMMDPRWYFDKNTNSATGGNTQPGQSKFQININNLSKTLNPYVYEYRSLATFIPGVNSSSRPPSGSLVYLAQGIQYYVWMQTYATTYPSTGERRILLYFVQ